MELKTKFAVFLLLVALLLSGAVATGLDLYRDRTIQQERVRINETATMTANEIDDDIRNSRARLASAAISAESLSAVDLTAMLTGREIIGAQVVATNGTVVASRGRTALLENESFADRNSTGMETVRTGQTYVSEPVWLAVQDHYAAVIAAPIIVGGNVTGALATTAQIDGRALFERGVGDSIRVQVYLHESGRQVPNSTARADGLPRWIVGQATVDSTGWTVTVRRSTAPLRQQLRRLAALQGLGLLVVLVPLGGFALWEYYQNIRQIDRLQDAFRALRDGDYDYSLSLTTNDEWRQISAGYEHATTELAARERSLRDREQRLEVLGRVLRHNLRNDITVLNGKAQGIQRRTDDTEIHRLADDVLDIGWDLIGLSDQARQVEHALEVAGDDPVTHDLSELAVAIVEDITVGYDTVAVRTDVPETARIRSVPSLSTAIYNVVENACEYNDADEPVVDVSVVADGDTTSLVVADNGPGIPEPERAVIEAGEETDLEHGSGLGLWLVKWLVEKSDGEVDITDRDPRGTVVTLTFRTEPDDAGE